MVLVDHFQKLADDDRNGLDALDFFRGTKEFIFQVLLFFFQVFFLKCEVSEGMVRAW